MTEPSAPVPLLPSPTQAVTLTPAAAAVRPRGTWPVRLSDLRGAARLAVEATLGVTDVVEQVHHTILRRAAPLSLRPVAAPGPTGGITGLAYRSVRGVTRGVGQGLDLLLGPAAERVLLSAPVQALRGPGRPLRAGQRAADEALSRPRQAVLAALNGVLGDHLHDSGNPLALPMVLRHQGQVLLLPSGVGAARARAARPMVRVAQPVRGRLLVMVHGLCMNPWQWQPQPQPPTQRQPGADPRPSRPGAVSVDLGAALAADGDLSLLHVHYNTGLPVATNGRLLADRLQALMQVWPVPVRELVVVGHSMGGLVARSACHVAQSRGDDWLPRLSTLVCLGTPHHGAPLERGGRGLDLLLGVSPYTAAFARLGQLRSAGITDLRHGSVQAAPGRDNASDPRPPTPLPRHLRCYAVAGQVRNGPLSRRLGERGRAWLGDGLVPVDSALGQHALPEHCLAFPPEHRWVAEGLDHFQLTHHAKVLQQLRRWRVGQPTAAASGDAQA